MTRLVEARRPDTLEPLPVAGLPVEVQPLVVALNELLARLRTALEHERAFIADAAHELRSPLTALDLQMQTLASAADEPGRARALEQLRSGVLRANRLVEQMLSLARQQRGPAAAPERVSLVELALEVIEESLPLADRRHIDLGLAHAEPVAIQGDPDALRVLLRNLLDNALRYTPDGGQVDVLVRREQAATGTSSGARSRRHRTRHSRARASPRVRPFLSRTGDGLLGKRNRPCARADHRGAPRRPRRSRARPRWPRALGSRHPPGRGFLSCG